MKNIAPGVCVKGFIRRFSVVLHQKKQIDKIDERVRKLGIITKKITFQHNNKRVNGIWRDF
ncbi:hypothetical protein SEEM1594_08166 [Salmonella enterica subsp. enterica serovar Muenchen str. baa1594]|nr:hypothetical protein SEEM1594_08166 [Salmonella enterica subsp. enterica serovar Muenchen str. baa1594]